MARHELTQEGFLAKVRESLDTFVKETLDSAAVDAFLARCRYVNVDMTNVARYSRLQEVVDQHERVMVNYLAVSPSLFGNICQGLNQAGLVAPETRVVLEKPIGTDLESSKEIKNPPPEGARELSPIKFSQIIRVVLAPLPVLFSLDT